MHTSSHFLLWNHSYECDRLLMKWHTTSNKTLTFCLQAKPSLFRFLLHNSWPTAEQQGDLFFCKQTYTRLRQGAPLYPQNTHIFDYIRAFQSHGLTMSPYNSISLWLTVSNAQLSIHVCSNRKPFSHPPEESAPHTALFFCCCCYLALWTHKVLCGRFFMRYV